VTSRIRFDLLDAFPQTDCPVCRLVERDVRQYIDGFFYESITVVERRAEIRSARGFCTTHSEILAGHSRTLGTAIIHHDVINDVLRSFPGENSEPSRGAAHTLRRVVTSLQQIVAETLRPKRECVLCSHELHQERIVLETLLAGLGEKDGDMRAAFAASGGICLPHLRTALEMRFDAGAQRALLDLQGDILRRLRADLALFIHKNNGSYAHDAIGDEAHAPARATRLVAGRRHRR
jgi:hypothetical protein